MNDNTLGGVISVSVAVTFIALVFLFTTCTQIQFVEGTKRAEATLNLKDKLIKEGKSAKEISCIVDKEVTVCLTISSE